MSVGISRRDALKLSGAAVGGLTLAGTASAWDDASPPRGLTQQNSRFQSLRPMRPDEPIDEHEMRISFMGTSVIERRAQQRSSVFVELGNGESFVFDCGSGAVSNYVAMGVPWSKMSKVFLTHLHGDHTSDLTHVYCFGPQGDRKFPLYVWGPSKSGIRNPAYDPGDPGNPEYFDDGTIEFCKHFREMNRWHTESQSFVATRFLWADGDGYDIFATELDWRHGENVATWSTNGSVANPSEDNSDWTAYRRNGVRISYFPVIHGRNGSIGYRLDWLDEGLSMIFTGDTKPSWRLVQEAAAGDRPVDVLISEVVVDPATWVVRQSGMTEADGTRYDDGLKNAQAVQENSHTPQKALGYILRQLEIGQRAPRLAVPTHFQASDDTIASALADIRTWYGGPVKFAADLMVIRATRHSVVPYRAIVPDYSWSARWASGGETSPPRYADTRACNPYAPMAPLAQLDDELLADVIAPEEYDPGGWQDVNNNGACRVASRGDPLQAAPA
jgi:ribonuclease Z